FIVKVRAMDRGRFLTGLSRYHVGYGLHFPAAHLLTHIRQRYGCRPGMLPVTEEAAERIVSLPLYPDMAEDDVLYVGEAVKALIRDEGGSS
ncbi:MAG: DegT/DnrJ/EryC1/StrS family aminotransferase, partial [Syntrophales bacterium]|nr:DegT/DnrJ/EryC1/StrS family aminotransferase [Syntrophales bacterium]